MPRLARQPAEAAATASSTSSHGPNGATRMGTSIPNLVQNGVMRAVPLDDELFMIFSSDLSCTYLLFIALAFRAGSRFAGGTMCRMMASIVLLICFSSFSWLFFIPI